MKTDFLDPESFQALLCHLTKENQQVLSFTCATGMRITDALQLTWTQISGVCLGAKRARRLHYVEKKTFKRRTVIVPLRLLEELGNKMQRVWRYSPWVFPGRDPRKHRTRQAVWKDLKKASRAAGIAGNIGTHTARKVYAVRLYNDALDKGEADPMGYVQRELNHTDTATTMIYALADIMAARRDLKKMS